MARQTAEILSFERPVPGNPVVAASALRDISGDSGSNLDIDGQGVAARARHQRIFGNAAETNRRKRQGPMLMGWGIMGAQDVAAAIGNSAANGTIDDNTREALAPLRSGVEFAGQAIGTMGYAMVGVQAAFVGAGVVSDVRSAGRKAGNTIAREVTEEVAEAGTRTAAKASAGEAAEAGTKAAARTVAGEAAEAGTKTAARTVAAEAAVEGASRGLFGRILGAAGNVALGAGRLLKKVPVIGGLVTAGFVAYEMASHVRRGDFDDAFDAAVIGGAEIVGSTAGFVVGDAARTATREFMIRNGYADEDVWMGDIQSLVVAGRDVYDQFQESAQAPANYTHAPVATVDLALRAA
ncbi:MAG: hypothetical protein AAGB32_01540 [Pseudomonadota bacterium]